MSDDLVNRLLRPWDTDRSIMSQTAAWMTERQQAAERIMNLSAKLATERARIRELEAELAALEPAPVTPAEAARVLRRFVYETTHLSPVEDDGSHWCRISKECLEGGRAALRALADAGEAGE